MKNKPLLKLFYKKYIYYEMSFTENDGRTLKYKEYHDAYTWEHYWWWHQLTDQTLLWAKEVFIPKRIGRICRLQQIDGEELDLKHYNRK